MNGLMRYIVLFLVLFVITFKVFAQASYEDIKSALVLQLAKGVGWHNEKDYPDFSIGFIGSDTVTFNAFVGNLGASSINKKPIRLVRYQSFDEIDNIRLLYLDKQSSLDVKSAAQAIERRNILLLTEDAIDTRYIMLNIVRDSLQGKVSFEINKANILIENLRIEPELLLLGGTEVDVRELYREIKREHDLMEEKSDVQYKIIQNQIARMTRYHVSLDSLKKLSAGLRADFDSTLMLFTGIKDSVQNQRNQLQKQEQQMKRKEEDLVMGNAKLIRQSDLLEEQQIALEELKEDRKVNARIIHEQEDIMASHEELIRIQKFFIALFVAFIFLVILLAAVIYRAYRDKKKINALLEAKVHMRTKDLNAVNEQLRYEIGERIKYENELSQSERNYREIYNATNEAIFIHNEETGEIIDVNSSFERMFGYSFSEAKTLSIADLSGQGKNYSQEEALRRISLAVHEGTQVFEWQSRAKDGKLFWAEVSLRHSQIGGENRVLAVVRDINDKKLAEQQLQFSEGKYRSLFEGSRDGIVIVLDTAEIIDCNTAYCNMLGYTKEEMRGVSFFNITPEKWRKWEQEEILDKQLMHKGQSVVYEKEYIRKNGEVFPIELIAYRDQLATGETIFWASVREITQQRLMERVARQSELKFQALFEQANDGILIMDQDLVFDCNAKTLEMFQCEKTNIVGESIVKFSPEKQYDGQLSKDKVNQMLSKAYEGHEQSFEWLHSKASGELFDVDISLKMVDVEGAKFIQVIARDISEKKRIEKALKDSEAYYRSLYENISDGIFILDVSEHGDFSVYGVNPAEAKFLGLTDAHVTGRSIREVVPVKVVDTVVENYQRCAETRKLVNYELQIDKESGKNFYSTTLIPLINDKNRVSRIIGVARDITDRKLAQQRTFNTIIKTEEKERSRLAKDLHDGLGPILSTIKLYIDWIADPNKKTDSTQIIKKVDATLHEAMTSLKEISTNLSPHILVNYGLNAAVKSFVDRIIETKNVRIRFDSTVKGRLNQNIETTIYRILIECMNNTIKYAQASEILIKINEELEWVSFSYTDNGVGFNLEEAMGENKGLGLNNMKNRIEMVGGDLKIASQPGAGMAVSGSIRTTLLF